MIAPVMISVNVTEGSGIATHRSYTTTIGSANKFVSSINERFLVSPVRSGPPDAGNVSQPKTYHDSLSQGFAGLDDDDYPGDYAMRWLLHNTNLKWTAFFLAPGPSELNTSWMTKYHYLRDLGWGFAPIFFGQQEPSVPGSHILTAEQGILDGRQAIKLAHQAGIPQGSVIFLDIETGGNLSSGFLDYYRAWIKEIFSNNFRPGVYCDFLKTADQLQLGR